MRTIIVCGLSVLALAAGFAVAQQRPERPQDGERPRGPQRPDSLLALLDLDKDGALSAEEIAAAPETLLHHLDKDRDGMISADELKALQQRRPGGEDGGDAQGPRGNRGGGGFMARYD